MSWLVEQSPGDFAERLLAKGRRRAWLVYDPDARAYWPSDESLRDLAGFLGEDDRDCHGHEAIFLEVGRETGALFGAFLHQTRRGQGHGGVRRVRYEKLEDFLRDGLRLSLNMSRKTALANLWWGGGKGLIARPPAGADRDPAVRRAVYREFGAFASSLRGCYVAAQDAGTAPVDMAELAATTRFATCLPRELGGSGSPAAITAAGVVCAIQAVLEFRGLGPVRGRSFAVQGTGAVGSALIERLLAEGAERIVATEVSAERCAAIGDTYEDAPVEIRHVPPGDRSLLAEPCDVFVPCALGGVLGPKSIPLLRARIVCGAANDPLVDDFRDDRSLEALGITFVPDFVSNRMGIVACANEQYGQVNNDPCIERHLDRAWSGGIYVTTLRVLEVARAIGVTPVGAAAQLADELSTQTHPIWGHRTHHIIESLVADRWADG